MKTKIIHVTQSSARGLAYGIGTYLENSMSCLRDHYDFEIVDFNATIPFPCIRYSNGYKRILIPCPFSNTSEKHLKNYLRNVAFALRTFFLTDNSFYIFHFHIFHFEILAEWLKKLFNCKIIATIHYSDWNYHLLENNNRYNSIVDKKSESLSDNSECSVWDLMESNKKISQYFDHFICPANHTVHSLRDILLVAPSKMTVINHGIKDEYADYKKDIKKIWKKNFFLSSKTQIIVFVGRLDKIKGVNFLISAFEKVLIEKTNVHLFIAGEGNFEELISPAKNICSKVSFTGKLSKEELRDLYNMADIGVVCSFYEEFGYVALEMIMHGIPIIVTETTGLDEMIQDNITGLKVPIIMENDKRVVDVDTLSQKILLLLRDYNLRKKLSKNGRQHYLEKYNLSIFKEKMIDFYNMMSDELDKENSP